MSKCVLFGAICALISSQISFADNSFYAGIKAGGEAANSKLEGDNIKVEGIGANGGIYGTYFGYAIEEEGTSFALEAEYAKRDSEAKYKIGSLEEKFIRRDEYGVNAVASMQVYTNLNFFVLAGISKAKFEGKTNTGLKGDDKVRGNALGLGLEVKNESPARLRVEYRFTKYKYKDIDFDYCANVHKKLDIHALTLGVHFHF